MNDSAACLSPAKLRELNHDDLSPQRWIELEEHVSSCSKCRRMMEQLDADKQWEREVRTALSDGASIGIDALPGKLSGHETHHEAEGSLQSVLSLLGPTDDPRMVGRIGTYEIAGVLGRGGMGVVFKGFDGALNRYVAIKMLLPHLAASGAARKRFAREAQAAAAVVNDHVMAIHSVAEWQGMPYLVMPYSRGSTLQKRLNDTGPLDLVEILRIGTQTAKGLAAAHAQGLVHRDVKPANILLDEGVDRVALTDFGLARAVDDIGLTRNGLLAGTPQFMSPEQARGLAVDSRSDLFSLGCVLYAMCTGQAPFRAESSYAVLRLISDAQPRSIRENNPAIPEWLERIVFKLLSKSPEDRIATATDLAVLLEQCLAHVQQPTAAALPKSVGDWVILPAPSPPASPWFRKTAQVLAGLALTFALIGAGFGFHQLLRTNFTQTSTTADPQANPQADSTAPPEMLLQWDLTSTELDAVKTAVDKLEADSKRAFGSFDPALPQPTPDGGNTNDDN